MTDISERVIDVEDLAERLVDAVKSHAKEPVAPVVELLQEALTLQHQLGRADALREVDVWLEPVLDQAGREQQQAGTS